MAKQDNPFQIKTKPANRRFELETKFKGYRHRFDLTKEEDGVLVVGSKNVLCKYGDQVEIRKGYDYLGQKGTLNKPIITSYDFDTFSGYEAHLRGYNIGEAVTLLEYFDPFTEKWFSLIETTGISEQTFATWWDSTTYQNKAIWLSNNPVGGDPYTQTYSYLYTWTGATAKILSYSTGTLTISGTQTIQALGFATSGTLKTQGLDITYTGISTDGLSFTGCTSSATILPNFAVVDSNFNPFKLTPGNTGGATGVLKNFVADILAIKDNHLYLASYNSRNIYISKVNDFSDYTFGGSEILGGYPSYGTAKREQGEGAILQVDEFPRAMIVQEDDMYISCGKSKWFYTVQDQNTQSITVSDTALTFYYENIYLKPLKTTFGQGAQSQSLCTSIYNNIAFVSYEPTFTTIGRIKQVNQKLDGMLGSPALSSLSDPIILDFQNYNFTDGQIKYYQDSVYISLPKEGLVLIYNTLMEWWEAPQTLPIGRFSVINGDLIGHSYDKNESYILFKNQNDINFAIPAVASFSFMNGNERESYKTFDEWYTEGYINSATQLKLKMTYDFTSEVEVSIDGSNPDITFATKDYNYLGSGYLGKYPLGTINKIINGDYKFRSKKTFEDKDFFEVQSTYSTNELNAYWSILAYGGNTKLSKNDTVIIKE